MVENRLILNANFFYTKWKDQQVTEQGDSSNIFDVYTINAGKSTIKGIEIDTKYQVNNHINLYGSVGYVQSKFNKYEDEGANTPYDYSGNDLSHTPNITANIGASYRNTLGYFVGGNINYSGSAYEDSANTQRIDSYYTLNMKTGYEDKNFSIYIYANNLLDKKYVINNYGDDKYELGDPRVIGLNMKFYW